MERAEKIPADPEVPEDREERAMAAGPIESGPETTAGVVVLLVLLAFKGFLPPRVLVVDDAEDGCTDAGALSSSATFFLLTAGIVGANFLVAVAGAVGLSLADGVSSS